MIGSPGCECPPRRRCAPYLFSRRRRDRRGGVHVTGRGGGSGSAGRRGPGGAGNTAAARWDERKRGRVAGAAGAAGTGAHAPVAGGGRDAGTGAARRAAAEQAAQRGSDRAAPEELRRAPAVEAPRAAPATAARPRQRRRAGTAPALMIPGTGNCTPPAGANVADARAAYAKWKTDLVTSDGAGGFLRVRRPNSSGAEVNSTISEGIAYGMLLAVYARRPADVRQALAVRAEVARRNGLMNWYINAAGSRRWAPAPPATPTRTWPSR